MAKFLVTGGAGFIGSHLVDRLIDDGHHVAIVDDLSTGARENVNRKAAFHEIDIRSEDLGAVFDKEKPDYVSHHAAQMDVRRSVREPMFDADVNVLGSINLIENCLQHDVKKIVYISTGGAVYGEPESTPITEIHPKRPVNAYGESKLIFERILDWYGKAYGVQHISFRYFNAAGSSQELGEDHHPETHLIPNVLGAVMNNESQVKIFGTDYPTRDGTCVRDYVHVADIARAHLLGLEKLGEYSGRAYNLGNGEGYTVLEVIAAAERVTRTDERRGVFPTRTPPPASLCIVRRGRPSESFCPVSSR